MFNLFNQAPQIYPTTSSSALNTANQLVKEEREFNAAEAQKNREWQEYMSNTAFQRQVADLEKAGINPYFALSGGGATVGSGSSASSNGFASSALSALYSNINTAMNNQTSRDIAIMNNLTKTFNNFANIKSGFDLTYLKHFLRY